MFHKAFKFETGILAGGKLELTTALPAGSRVEVLVIQEEADELTKDVMNLASSSLDFWDNPLDDAEWNDA